MSLLWTVPVVAAAVAAGFVAAHARALEDASVGLGVDVRRLRELQSRLAAVHAGLGETRERAAALTQRHRVAPADDTS